MREVVRLELERRLHKKTAALMDSRLVGIARRMAGAADVDIAAQVQAIQAGIPEAVGKVIASMLKADCPCRNSIVADARTWAETRLSATAQWRAGLTAFIESGYHHVASRLVYEFRVFTGANALVFLLLAAIAFRRRGAAVHLLLPAAVLVGAALLTGGLYLFEQNWLRTILFDRYVGLAYFAYLLVALGFLSDIAFNRGRVTTNIVNGVVSVVGGVADIMPC